MIKIVIVVIVVGNICVKLNDDVTYFTASLNKAILQHNGLIGVDKKLFNVFFRSDK